jgi:hypothetical protein
MGMYTELIFGASIRNIPEAVETIKWLLLPIKDKLKTPFPDKYPFVKPFSNDNRIDWMFNSGGSYYFGANSGIKEFNYDEISNCWRFDARFNIKNYSQEIEMFLQWIKPYIEQGSGARDFYAIVTYEESDNPTIYYLHDE